MWIIHQIYAYILAHKHTHSAHTNEYPTIFKNAVRISNVPFSDIVLFLSSSHSHCSCSRVRSVFFSLAWYSSFLFHWWKMIETLRCVSLILESVIYVGMCVVRIFDSCWAFEMVRFHIISNGFVHVIDSNARKPATATAAASEQHTLNAIS